ncbi:hypothetical protein AciX9_2016 [Granulicella tundricola MP5ACTX9]|uniref:Uncharacterized protein n=1 Tax=Granulicella tundricola (strain ATCC BAA-1859 / DSM 23138 / MP5ACTX9) TaxID=1198114 RepID=E8X1A7_GRATM|nr:hypothetical protein AciX9_2016 [Granulicella tundricola MP5ACTX9]
MGLMERVADLLKSRAYRAFCIHCIGKALDVDRIVTVYEVLGQLDYMARATAMGFMRGFGKCSVCGRQRVVVFYKPNDCQIQS